MLTYHLGWVTTVSPYDTNTDSQLPESSARRPYNALWAQLSDLCGNIGFPPRAARTIICGTNQQFMNKLLVVLTYFIRCGEVKRSEFNFQCNSVPAETVTFIGKRDKPKSSSSLKRTATCSVKLQDLNSDNKCSVKVSSDNTLCSSSSTLVASEVDLKAKFPIEQTLSSSSVSKPEDCIDKPMTSQLKRTPTIILPIPSDDSISSSSEDSEDINPKVVFVLGDDERLIGLKNKSNGGKSVKKSSKIHNEPVTLELEDAKMEGEPLINRESPSKCCGQQSQHSMPLKHSGIKFEFDKYPQIVTNYMKSKNLEILDRHYIGKPGNLKLDKFHFDPMVVPPLQEERCETCYKCQMMESTLQTPTNASELEYMNDVPRMSEPQFAREIIVESEIANENKKFIRKRKENTVVVNIKKCNSLDALKINGPIKERKTSVVANSKDESLEVKKLIEVPMAQVVEKTSSQERSGFDSTLLGGVNSHYVPDLILQGWFRGFSLECFLDH